MHQLSKNSIAALGVAIATILIGTWAVTSARTTPPVKVLATASTPVPTAAPRPSIIPVPPIAVARHPSAECPQMNNPGGRLQWAPSANPNPTPTNVRIKMPTLGVDAPVVRVGIDGQNKMVVPHNAKDVAWLDRGGVPGYTNNVVLAGHIAYSHVPGSFGRIGDLHPGDDLVLQISGKSLHYRVQWACLFGRNTDRAEQIMGYTYAPSLTLISCGGGWDASAGTHTSRWAIRAQQVAPPTPTPVEPGLGAEQPASASPTATPHGLLHLGG